ncbi:MAG: SEL1-like repeat protein [Clostridia bacterium]|nr:SEL1-like repeat protein [Clostridia bacterium]
MTKKELKELRARAVAGDAQSQCELAEYYNDISYGSRKYESKVYYWYDKACEQGYTEGEYGYGWCLYYGVGIRVCQAELSLEYFLKAAQKGHVGAMKMLFELYSFKLSFDKRDFNEAVFWIKKVAETGDADAEYELGDAYLHGFVFSRFSKCEFKLNPEEGIKWLKSSAEHKNAKAMVMLGDCYIEGLGVEKNVSTALEWYERGAEGRSDGLYKLGELYFNGELVEKDLPRALDYYERAKKGLNTEAMLKLGDCYYNGWGVEKNYETALEHYKHAANMDTTDYHGARSNLALKYARDEVYHDEFMAVYCLKSVVNYTQNPEVYYEIAKRCLIGLDFRDEEHPYVCYVIHKDAEDAACYFKLASKERGGYPPAYLEYGKCLLSGFGVEADKEKAKIWLQKAADCGIAEAAEILKNI